MLEHRGCADISEIDGWCPSSICCHEGLGVGMGRSWESHNVLHEGTLSDRKATKQIWSCLGTYLRKRFFTNAINNAYLSPSHVNHNRGMWNAGIRPSAFGGLRTDHGNLAERRAMVSAKRPWSIAISIFHTKDLYRLTFSSQLLSPTQPS